MDTIVVWLERLMPYLFGTAVAALVYVKFWLDNKRTQDQVKSLEDQIKHSDEQYYVICPTCGSKLMLAKLKIYIEQKAKEDNQNGDNN